MPPRRPPTRLSVLRLESRDVPTRLAYTPGDIRGAYGLGGLAFDGESGEVSADGAGQTIAIVTAFGSPTAAADLAEFSIRFGLPAARLTILDADGNRLGATPPPPDGLSNWATETAADLQWAHAIAPGADLLLVTAHGTTDADLMQAAATARDYPGVSVVSMSFGRGEFPGQSAFDSVFTSPRGRGVSFVAASGDTSGTAQFLAYSPRVLGVGGTSLTLSSDNRYQSETAWRDGPAGSSGGFSRFVNVPQFQKGEINFPEFTRPMRGGPDVALVADRLWVYDRSGTTAGPWLVSSGTSLSAPMWAGILALANQGRALGGATTLDGSTQTLPLLYAAPVGTFRDILDPTYPASGPWDWTTGLGTPVIGALLTHLIQDAGGVTVVESGSSPGSGGSGGSNSGGSGGGSSGGGSTPGGSSGSAGGSTGGSGSSNGGGSAGNLGPGLIAASSGWGEPGTVTGFNPSTGQPVFVAHPFPGFTGGLRVAAVDLGDGLPDVLVGTGPGIAPTLLLLDSATARPIREFDTFEESFTGGLFVAVGDLDGDGVPDFVVTPDEGGGPRVVVISGRTGERIADFFGIEDPDFRGGARATVGDLNGDGQADLIVAAGYGGGPRVAVYDGRTVIGSQAPVKLLPDFFAMDPNLRNGLYVAAGDVFGRGQDDLLLGAGPGGAPRVLAVDGRTLAREWRLAPLADFYAGDSRSRGGAPVAVTRLDDGTPAVLVGSGRGSSAVKVFSPAAFQRMDPAAARELVFDETVKGGVYVG